MPNSTQFSKNFILAAFILALGLILSGYLLGSQAKMIGASGSIKVKGLAERPIKADTSSWGVSLLLSKPTYAEALKSLRKEKTNFVNFLNNQGVEQSLVNFGPENVYPKYETVKRDDRYIDELVGYNGSQTVIVTMKDLTFIQKLYDAALEYRATGASIDIHTPNYLVSNLEEIKMSLIESATQNAASRANEFVKHSQSSLDSIRSASQGAFYIIDENNLDVDFDNYYSGFYGKASINKTARVVVTVEFNIR